MAVTITSVGSATGIGAGPGFATGATVTATTANNDWLVVVVSFQPNLSISSVTDSAGNTYTARVNAIYSEGGTLGAQVSIYTAPVTSNITGGTVTVTLSAGSTVAALEVFRVRPASGTVTFVAADNAATGANATGHAAATVSVTNGNTIFGVGSIETNDPVTGDSDTTNGSWSTVSTVLADSGSDRGSQSIVSQYKTVNATGNQSWNCSTTSARAGISSYLVLKGEAAAFTIAAALGQYTMSGTAMTPHLGNVPMVAGAGSYALTGTDATFVNSGTNKVIAAAAGDYSLLGTDATTTHGYVLDATTAGSYALTGTAATLFRNLPLTADPGSYALTGTDATLTKASLTNKVLTADSGAYALTGTAVTLTLVHKIDATTAGAYVLTGSDVALATAANKVIVAFPGSYALTGSDATPAITVAPPAVSPLHIGEWPVDKKRRKQRVEARAKEQAAQARFRRAIGRLLEGLPPEFDEPEQLAEAEASAVKAFNLLRAMYAPQPELDAVSQLIDHIRQLRIAQPIAQAHLAQAYNQAHRLIAHKAQEDATLALLLGE